MQFIDALIPLTYFNLQRQYIIEYSSIFFQRNYMIKLPYLSIYYKSDHKKKNLENKLLHQADRSGLFRLKHMGKHVSQYQHDLGQDQFYDQRICKYPYTLQSTSLLRVSFKKDKNQEIMQKAKNLNNKHYPSQQNLNKTRFKNSCSLDRFSLAQRHQNSQSSKENSQQKQGHINRSHNVSISQTDNKLHLLKKSRPFRSKWFTEIKQI